MAVRALLVLGATGLLSLIERVAWKREQAPRIVATASRFEGAMPPAMVLDAPPGWALTFDKARGHVTADSVRPNGEKTRALFDTALTTDEIKGEPGVVRPLLSMLVEQQGFTVTDPVSVETVAQAPTHTVVMRGGDGSQLCLWFVTRGKHLQTTIHCASNAPAGCRAACAPVLAKLRWVTPVGVTSANL